MLVPHTEDMRILDFGAMPGRPVERFESVAFNVAAVGSTAGAQLVAIRLEAGGVIGTHPAVGRQLLVVLQGQAVVSGDTDSQAIVEAGQAVLWEAGENHQTRTDQGLLALVIEGELAIDGAEPAGPPSQ
jgi:quercetin dioxygenase-like cupin family protein